MSEVHTNVWEVPAGTLPGQMFFAETALRGYLNTGSGQTFWQISGGGARVGYWSATLPEEAAFIEATTRTGLPVVMAFNPESVLVLS